MCGPSPVPSFAKVGLKLEFKTENPQLCSARYHFHELWL